MSVSYNKAIVKSVSKINSITDSFKDLESEIVESLDDLKTDIKHNYAKKDSVKDLRNYTKGRFNKMEGKLDKQFKTIKNGLEQSVETANKILERISDPTLTAYKEMWKEQKAWVQARRDILYVIVDSFKYQNIFYRGLHYPEYLKDLAKFNQIDSVLQKMWELECEYDLCELSEIEKEEDYNE
jgi:flagellar hook-associated protein FlgK